MNPRIVYF